MSASDFHEFSRVSSRKATHSLRNQPSIGNMRPISPYKARRLFLKKGGCSHSQGSPAVFSSHSRWDRSSIYSVRFGSCRSKYCHCNWTAAETLNSYRDRHLTLVINGEFNTSSLLRRTAFL
jgi:hypothetical protein